MKLIVKRQGHTEAYDSKKIYASVYSAVLSVRGPAATAELVAQEVTDGISDWVKNKHEVTSNDIRRVAAEHLRLLNPDAAHIYKNHRKYS